MDKVEVSPDFANTVLKYWVANSSMKGCSHNPLFLLRVIHAQSISASEVKNLLRKRFTASVLVTLSMLNDLNPILRKLSATSFSSRICGRVVTNTGHSSMRFAHSEISLVIGDSSPAASSRPSNTMTWLSCRPQDPCRNAGPNLLSNHASRISKSCSLVSLALPALSSVVVRRLLFSAATFSPTILAKINCASSATGIRTTQDHPETQHPGSSDSLSDPCKVIGC
mmetsp:Transcript_85202/g.227766  ORF Transcript_85202/g.227766 Transcript_85202/m.227766 type:complete len:225 (-) Transcript_85202:2265-2939(-)